MTSRDTGDDDLHAPVEASLETESTRTIAPGSLARESVLPAESLGAAIGPYVLKAVLGSGGMGVVYLAEQRHPVRREVALKVVKPGMDSAQVISRFEAERQALAAMDHPNIAKVLDAGTTSGGRPYFVMELVHGVPITKYCDFHRLTLRERLELFIPVCQATQHAHQKGIIHRDIKPSNILVPVYDGKPVPKVIDFGIAKAIEQSLSEPSLTQAGTVIGTLEYMSPEQAEAGGLDLDTRSDIYSLGAVLYELLTETTPLQTERQAKHGYYEILRLIRELEPPPPSARVTASRATLPAIAAHRGTDAAKLSRVIRGELDWIVMKALEKDRTRRYASANGLARDVERYLHSDPLEASPPSASYRFRKFARRHRLMLAAGSAIALILVAAAIVSTAEAIRANRERDRALYALREAESEKFAGYANAGLAEDPERSIALGMYAVAATRKYHQEVPPAALSVLHAAILASHVRLNIAGHKDSINSVAFSPDGHTIATGSEDNTAKIWDAGTGKPLLTLRHPDWVWSVAFSPDGKHLATGSTDHMVRVWDLATQHELLTLQGHLHSVTRVAFSPDGKLLASAGVDKSVKIWDAATGKLLHTLNGHTRPVAAVTFSPDGKRLATASMDKTVKMWEVAGGRELFTLSDQTPFWDVAFNPAGTSLALAGERSVTLWDIATRRKLLTLSGHENIIQSVAFDSSGTRLVSAGRDGTVKLWAAETGRELRTLRGHKGSVFSAAFSRDGERLVTAGQDRRIRLWDTDPDSELSVHKSIGLFIDSDATRTLKLSSKGTAEVIEFATLKTLLTFPVTLVSLSRVASSGNGKRLAVSYSDTTAKVWDLLRGSELITVRHNAEITDLAFSHDGKLLVTAGADKKVRLWDVAAGVNTVTFEGHQKLVSRVSLSPDGSRLASDSEDGTIRLWDTSTGRNLWTKSGFTHRRGEVFSPDSTKVASYTDQGGIVWDVSSGRKLFDLRGTQGLLSQVAFNGDSSRLATGDTEGTVKVWNSAPLKELFTIRGAHAMIGQLVFSLDGKRIAAMDSDQVARVYTADTDLLLALAKRRLTRTLTPAECQTYFQRETCPVLPDPVLPE